MGGFMIKAAKTYKKRWITRVSPFGVSMLRMVVKGLVIKWPEL